MKPSEISRFLTGIKCMFQSFAIDEAVERAWLWALSEHSLKEATEALNSILNAGPRSFAPNPSEIIHEIKKIRGNVGSAALAWEMKGIGINDPIGARAFDVWGGKKRLAVLPNATYAGLTPGEKIELAQERKRFMEIYEAIQEGSRSPMLGSDKTIEVLGRIQQRIEGGNNG